jgi:hypothetical protein
MRVKLKNKLNQEKDKKKIAIKRIKIKSCIKIKLNKITRDVIEK